VLPRHESLTECALVLSTMPVHYVSETLDNSVLYHPSTNLLTNLLNIHVVPAFIICHVDLKNNQ